MKYKNILLPLFITAFMVWAYTQTFQAGNNENNFFYDSDQVKKIAVLHWSQNLTEEDVETIKDGFYSKSVYVQLEALKSVAVHQLDQMESEINMASFNDPLPKLRQILLKNIGSNATDYCKWLAENVDTNEIKFGFKVTHGYNNSSVIASILTIIKCKQLRNNFTKAIDFPNIPLSNAQNLLLSYSKVSKQRAINELIFRILRAELASSNHYDTLTVLNSYGVEATNILLNRMLPVDSLKTITKYGKHLALSNILWSVSFLSQSQKETIKTVLLNADNIDNYFSELPSLQNLVINIDERLVPDVDYNRLQNRLKELGSKFGSNTPNDSIKIDAKRGKGYDGIDLKNDSIIVVRSFSRPEDRGENLSKLAKEDIISRLNIVNFDSLFIGVNHRNHKCIELRKIAQVLGDRQLAGTLVLTNEERVLVNKTILNYIHLYNRRDEDDFEEITLQFQRFGPLAIPLLLNNVDHPNPGIRQLTTNAIVEMRTEEAIVSVIRKAKATKDIKTKRWLRQALSMMNLSYKPSVPNREYMDEATTREVYERLIVPALAELEKEIAEMKKKKD